MWPLFWIKLFEGGQARGSVMTIFTAICSASHWCMYGKLATGEGQLRTIGRFRDDNINKNICSASHWCLNDKVSTGQGQLRTSERFRRTRVRLGVGGQSRGNRCITGSPPVHNYTSNSGHWRSNWFHLIYWTVQSSSLQCSRIQCSVGQWWLVYCNVIQCSAVWVSVGQCWAVYYNVIQSSAM